MDMWRILRPDVATMLMDEMARKSLARYFSVTQDEKPAKSRIAKKIPAEFGENNSIEELWQKHGRLTQKFYKIEREIDTRQKNLRNMPNPKNPILI